MHKANDRGERPKAAGRRALGFFLVLLVAAAVAARRPLLRAVAGALVVDQPIRAPVDAIWVHKGDRRFDIAAALHRRRPGLNLLIVQRRPERVMAAGLEPTNDQIDRRELLKRGIPSAAIQLIPGDADNEWQRVRNLGGWMADHPRARVLVLTGRFGSRRVRYMLDHTLPEAARRRVQVRALRDRRWDETNWWRTRDGIEQVVDGWVRLAYAVVHGPDAGETPRWSYERYLRALRRTAPGGAAAGLGEAN